MGFEPKVLVYNGGKIMATPHNSANKGDFAKTVLMPGDPLRAEFIADNFLDDVRKVTSGRNVYGFTGKYKGKDISIMASGMGMPSMGIYSYELFNFYDVENIIRIVSAGSISDNCHVRDIVIAQGACTNGNYAAQYNLPGTYAPIASFELLEKAVAATRASGAKFKVGNIFSSDMFYDDAASAMAWSKMGVLGVEMESAALYCNAARLGKNGLCICTISDSFNYPEENTTAEERQTSFTKMMEIALEIA
jgi:purine-nucleoside phosphorylase